MTLLIFSDQVYAATPDFVGVWSVERVQKHGPIHFTVFVDAEGSAKAFYDYPSKNGYNPGFWTYEYQSQIFSFAYCAVLLDDGKPAGTDHVSCTSDSPGVSGKRFTSDTTTDDHKISGVFENSSSPQPQTPMTWTKQ